MNLNHRRTRVSARPSPRRLHPPQFEPLENRFLLATFVVNDTRDLPDSLPGDGVCDADLAVVGDQCTLRGAIMEANATPGPDDVQVPAGTFKLSRPPTGSDPNDSEGDLDVTGVVAIVGAGVDETIVDGGGIDRVFRI